MKSKVRARTTHKSRANDEKAERGSGNVFCGSWFSRLGRAPVESEVGHQNCAIDRGERLDANSDNRADWPGPTQSIASTARAAMSEEEIVYAGCAGE